MNLKIDFKPFFLQGGMYVVQLFDNYAATYSLLAIGLAECLALSWVYGKFNSYFITLWGCICAL